jgi:K+-sensing histidine kinase KdpD
MRAGVRHKPNTLLGYVAAVLVAVVAQICRIPLHPATAMPFITYMPFILLAIWYGGFGPGILASALCTLESVYFATDPAGSFEVADPQNWGGLRSLP